MKRGGVLVDMNSLFFISFMWLMTYESDLMAFC